VGTPLYVVHTPSVSPAQFGLGASSFLAYVHGIEDGYPEAPVVAEEKALCAFLAEAASSKAITSAHDLSDGGFAVAAAEIALKVGGVTAGLESCEIGDAAVLFGEVPGRVLIGVADVASVEKLVSKHGLGLTHVGTTTVAGLEITVGGNRYSWSDESLRDAFEGAIPQLMTY
jgi:phosphoribosylformylglycinamidine synthase